MIQQAEDQMFGFIEKLDLYQTRVKEWNEKQPEHSYEARHFSYTIKNNRIELSWGWSGIEEHQYDEAVVIFKGNKILVELKGGGFSVMGGDYFNDIQEVFQDSAQVIEYFELEETFM